MERWVGVVISTTPYGDAQSTIYRQIRSVLDYKGAARIPIRSFGRSTRALYTLAKALLYRRSHMHVPRVEPAGDVPIHRAPGPAHDQHLARRGTPASSRGRESRMQVGSLTFAFAPGQYEDTIPCQPTPRPLTSQVRPALPPPLRLLTFCRYIVSAAPWAPRHRPSFGTGSSQPG